MRETASATDPQLTIFSAPMTHRGGPAAEPVVRLCVEQLQQQLSSSKLELAPLPVVALRVSVFLKKADADTNELVRLIGQDPAITAKVLQVANSALYSPTRPLESVRAAIAQMGTKAVSTLVLGEATRSMFDPGARALPPLYKQMAGQLFHDAATTAHGAGALAMALRLGQMDRVYLGGMLHDIGKPLLLRLLAQSRSPPLEIATVDAILEELHVEAGKCLSKLWELPEGLATLCAQHHDARIPEGQEGDDVHLLRVASGIVAHLRGAGPRDLNQQVLQSINALGISADRIRSLVTDARDHSKMVVATYGLDAAVSLVPPEPGRPGPIATSRKTAP